MEIVYHDPNEGPVFGVNDIYIDKDFTKQKNQVYFPNCFEDNLNKGRSIFTGDPNNNNKMLLLKEVEVFKLINK